MAMNGVEVFAVGEPSWRINVDGGWDFVPLALAVGALLVLRIVFGVTLRWYVVAGVVLAAPLFRALGDRVGMPVAVGVALIVATVAVPAFRRSRRPRPPFPEV
jgi:hypothetical protein